jgi:hypothetical protein
MASIKVKLRIVGLYFNETVRINDQPGLTVRDVLDKYISEHPDISVVGGLEYIRFPFPGNSKDFVKTFTYHYGGIYNFDANNTLDVAPPPSLPTSAAPDGPTLGNQGPAEGRTAGIYTLSEDFEDELITGATRPVGLVWQYYVTSATGTNKSRTRVDRGFQAFGETTAGVPNYNLADGDTITWRLVAICREPNFNR